LKAENIKSGATIFGIKGGYSGSVKLTPLIERVTTRGDYERTPDRGSAYSRVELEIDVPMNYEEVSLGAITPTTRNQTFSAGDGECYRTFTVAGDSDLISSNIRKDKTIFGVRGEYTPILTESYTPLTLEYNGQSFSPDSRYEGYPSVRVNLD
jgi:hypothetical protein